MVRTLIFDCDGVLSDNERDGHLPAFNKTFEEFNLPVRWSVEEYGRKLKIGGGKERMASLLTPEFVRAAGLPEDREALAAEVARWHKRKTQIYTEMIEAGLLPPRPGIPRVISDALDAGWQLAVCSTSAAPSVRSVLNYVAGRALAARFALFLAGDVVPKKKPAPDIYQMALEHLGATPANTLVVEDSRNGLLAADGAGLHCIITVNGYTEREDFGEAVMVVTTLGDPGGERVHVIENRSAARPGDYITLGDLEACMNSDGRGGE